MRKIFDEDVMKITDTSFTLDDAITLEECMISITNGENEISNLKSILKTSEEEVLRLNESIDIDVENTSNNITVNDVMVKMSVRELKHSSENLGFNFNNLAVSNEDNDMSNTDMLTLSVEDKRSLVRKVIDAMIKLGVKIREAINKIIVKVILTVGLLGKRNKDFNKILKTKEVTDKVFDKETTLKLYDKFLSYTLLTNGRKINNSSVATIASGLLEYSLDVNEIYMPFNVIEELDTTKFKHMSTFEKLLSSMIKRGQIDLGGTSLDSFLIGESLRVIPLKITGKSINILLIRKDDKDRYYGVEKKSFKMTDDKKDINLLISLSKTGTEDDVTRLINMVESSIKQINLISKKAFSRVDDMSKEFLEISKKQAENPTKDDSFYSRQASKLYNLTPSVAFDIVMNIFYYIRTGYYTINEILKTLDDKVVNNSNDVKIPLKQLHNKGK